MATSGLILRPLAPEDRFSGISRGLPPVDDAIQIYLVTFGSVMPMRVLASDTISFVKMRIQQRNGFYTKQQKLVYGGRALSREDSLIRDYGVCNGEVLHLVLRLSDIVEVAVKSTNEDEYVLKVQRARSVKDLKQLISEKDGLAVDDQQLILEGECLEDQYLIEDLALEGRGAVHLIVQKSAKIRSRHVGGDIEISVTAPNFSEQNVVPSYACQFDGELKLPEPCTDHVNQYEFAAMREELSNISYLLEPAQESVYFDIPTVLFDALSQAKAGLDHRHAPILSTDGTGGVYFMQDSYGYKTVGVFKPVDEEPLAVNNPRGLPLSMNGEGLKRGTRVGEGAMKEVAAYILDHPLKGPRSFCGKDEEGYVGVPPTMMIRCYDESFSFISSGKIEPKRGSFQQYVNSFSNCEDMGPASFPVKEVHKISILDMRLANTDRNGGNILVCRSDVNNVKLVPIDHGYCLPDKFEDCTFEWLYWPQARIPYDAAELEYIASLDAEQDIALLEKHGFQLRPECARVLKVATMLLKKGSAAGLSPFLIGSMMCRDYVNRKSDIEEMIEQTEDNILPASSEEAYMETLSEYMDYYVEKSAKSNAPFNVHQIVQDW